jgi:hypothetical protein
MTHPKSDELMEYLYDDGLDAARRATIAEHLAACEGCRGRVALWGGVRLDLDAWELPAAIKQPVRTAPMPAHAWPVLRWAAAASVLLAVGYGLARMNPAAPAPSPARVAVVTPDLSAIRAEVAGQVRADLREEFRRELASEQAKFVADQKSQRELFQRVVARALGELEARQSAENAALRADIETVALRAQRELSQLAVSSQPADAGIPQER